MADKKENNSDEKKDGVKQEDVKKDVPRKDDVKKDDPVQTDKGQGANEKADKAKVEPKAGGDSVAGTSDGPKTPDAKGGNNPAENLKEKAPPAKAPGQSLLDDRDPAKSGDAKKEKAEVDQKSKTDGTGEPPVEQKVEEVKTGSTIEFDDEKKPDKPPGQTPEPGETEITFVNQLRDKEAEEKANKDKNKDSKDDKETDSPDEGPPSFDAFFQNEDEDLDSFAKKFQPSDDESSADESENAFVEIPPSYFTKVQRLYVKPNDDFVLESLNQSVAIIRGKPNTGKHFSTYGLIQECFRDSAGDFRTIYRINVDNSKRGLHDLIRKNQGDFTNSVFVLFDFLRSGFGMDELRSDKIDTLTELLASQSNLLIITVNADFDTKLPANCATISITGSRGSADEGDSQNTEVIREIVNTHLKNYNLCYPGNKLSDKALEEVTKAIDVIAERFHSPAQVGRLFERCGEVDDEELNLDLIIDRISRVDPKWFSQLSENARLYALLIALFNDASAENIHLAYSKLCRILRSERYPLRDARKIGLDKLRREISVRVGHENDSDLDEYSHHYEFEDPDLAHEANKQIENFRDLLWSAVLYLYDDDEIRPRIYYSLGKAIGRLGVNRWHQFEVQLDILGDSEPKNRTLLPALALATMIEERPKDVLVILKSWIEKRRLITYFFNAVDAVRECYRTVASSMALNSDDREEILDDLDQLSRSIMIHHFQYSKDKILAPYFNDLAHEIYRVSPERFVDNIRDWMTGERLAKPTIKQKVETVSQATEITFQEPESSGAEDDEELDENEAQKKKEEREKKVAEDYYLAMTGYFYAIWMLLWQRHEGSETIEGTELDRRFQLAELILTFESNREVANSRLLVNELVETTESNTDDANSPIPPGMSLIREWISESNQHTIHQKLRSIQQEMSVSQRRKLRQVLQEEWLTAASGPEVEIAEGLLTFAYLLDGHPIDPSPDHRGCLIVGLSGFYNAKERDQAWNVYKRLANHVRIDVAGQGMPSWLNDHGEFLTSAQFDELESGLPLCVPVLESIDVDKTHFILIIKWTMPAFRLNNESSVMIDLPDFIPEFQEPDSEGQPAQVETTIETLAGRTLQIEDAGNKQIPRQDPDAVVRKMHLWSKTTRNRIDDLISDIITERLSARDQETCRKALQNALNAKQPPETEDGFVALQDLVDRLGKETKDLGLRDWGSQLSGYFQWLLKADCKTSLATISRWMEPGSKRVPIAKAFFQLFFRLAKNNPSMVADPTDVIQLGDVFIKQTKKFNFEFVCLLELIRHWSEHAEYCTDFQFGEIGKRISEQLAKIPLGWRHQILVRIQKWIELLAKEPVTEEPPAESSEKPPVVSPFVDQPVETAAAVPPTTGEDSKSLAEKRITLFATIQRDILLGPIAKKPDSDQKVSLLIVDSSYPRNRRKRRTEIATRLFKLMRTELKGSSIVPCLYRTGVDTPVSVNDKIAGDRLYPIHLPYLPPLLLPILEQFQPENVHSLIFMADVVPLDWSEVLDYYPAYGYVHTQFKDRKIEWGTGRWQIGVDTDATIVDEAKTIWRDVKNLSEPIKSDSHEIVMES